MKETPLSNSSYDSVTKMVEIGSNKYENVSRNTAKNNDMNTILKKTQRTSICSSKAGSAKKDARESTQTPPIVSAKEDLDKLNDLFRGSSLKKIKQTVGGRSAYL